MATLDQLSQACTYHIVQVHDFSIYKQIRWSMNIGCTLEQKERMMDIVQRSYERLQILKPNADNNVDLWENVIALFSDIT